MPWTSSDADRHKKGLTPLQQKRWAAIANDVLKSSGDEGKAIRIANAKCCEAVSTGYRQYVAQVSKSFADDSAFVHMSVDAILDTLERDMAAEKWGPHISQLFTADHHFRAQIEDALMDLRDDARRDAGLEENMNMRDITRNLFMGTQPKEKGAIVESEGSEPTTPVCMLGKTTKIVDFMKASWDRMQKEAKDRVIAPEEYWQFMMKGLKAETGLTETDLLFSGFPATLVVECLTEADASASNPIAQYPSIILKMTDGKEQKLATADVLTKITPFTKKFKSPAEALVKGKPQDVLAVLKKVYGDKVASWRAPIAKTEKTEAIAIRIAPLTALLFADLYNAMKHGADSALIGKDGAVKKEGVQHLAEAFDKGDTDWVLGMFPNANEEYVKRLISETKTVLDEIDADTLALMFPNISQEYLRNVRES